MLLCAGNDYMYANAVCKWPKFANSDLNNL